MTIKYPSQGIYGLLLPNLSKAKDRYRILDNTYIYNLEDY